MQALLNESLSYKITLTNTGEAELSNLLLTDVLAAGLAYLGNQLLRVTVAVDVCRIDEVDSQVDSSVKCGQRGLIICRTPGVASDAPGSVTNLADFPVRAS